MVLKRRNNELESQITAVENVAETRREEINKLQAALKSFETEKRQEKKSNDQSIGRKAFKDIAPSTVKKTRAAIKRKFVEPVNTFVAPRGLHLHQMTFEDSNGERLQVQVEPSNTYPNLTKGEKRRVVLGSRWKDLNRISDRVYAAAKQVSDLAPASHVKSYEQELNQEIQPVQQVDKSAINFM